MPADPALIDDLRITLRRLADPSKAPGMQAYMKSEMPYLGIQTQAREGACREVFARHPIASRECWRDTILELWRTARHREERYAAISLAGARAYAAFRDLDALPMYEELIVSGAWWDYVDTIASHHIGELLRKHPGPMTRTLRRWAKDPNLWKRRSAVLAQLTFKADTDVGLLYACIEPNLRDPEFFMRKAIGWALRQYAWTDPAEVRRYVRTNVARLSPLSQREALKNAGSSRTRKAPRVRS